LPEKNDGVNDGLKFDWKIDAMLGKEEGFEG